MDTVRTDVVVVGAGLSGLVAARELRSRGVNVVILEARDRVGGRTLNHPLGDGKVAELGGQWIGPGQDHIAALAGELGIGTFGTYDTGRKMVEFRGRLRSYQGAIPVVGPASTVDIGQAVRRLERMARQVPADAPWKAPHARSWDAETFASWIKRNTLTRFARECLSVIAESTLAVDPADLSLLHMLAHASAHRGFVALISTTGGSQERRFIGGSQRVSVVLAGEVADCLHMRESVRRIEHGDQVRVHTDGMVVEARRVVVAMSPSMAARLVYDPALPAQRDQLMQRMPLASVVKCIAVYDEPFWRAKGLSGQGLSDRGPVKVVFDNSPPDGRPGVLLGFVLGEQASRFGQLPEDQRRTAALDSFRRLFGPAASRPVEYVEKDWDADEWSRGGYAGFLPPRVWTSIGEALCAPVGAVHWAGSETAGTCMGSMDGAVRAGERVAAEVHTALSEVVSSR